MNIVFVTMGSMYQVYYDAYNEMKDKFDNVGFYVSDVSNFKKNFRDDDKVQYLKEWELTTNLQDIMINKAKIALFENKYFQDESIWHSLNNDRRIFAGLYVKNTQDYKAYYSYEEMLKVFQIFVEKIEKFIDDIKPDVVFGVTPSAFGDYLFYKILVAKGIKYYSLKTVKIGNYQTFTQTICEEHDHIKQTFLEYMNREIIDESIKTEADNFLEKFQKGSTAYEGNVAIQKNNSILKITDFKGMVRSVVKDIISINSFKDHHNRGSYLLKYLYDNPIKNYRSKLFKDITKSRTIYSLDEIESGNYIFFPLHAEPEIAITNYARFYQNQIEVIRNIALQLPSNFKLLVKEHPRNIGRRSMGYYKKILDIPNVDFVDFYLPSIEVVKKSKLIIVLSGNIGFEAVLLGKPVISLGNTPYNMLPNHIVNYVDNIKYLYDEIKKTIINHQNDSNTIKKYISAVIKNSFKLDLYTVLLKKSGREGGSIFDNEKYKLNIQKLSQEILDIIESKL
ncbi:hypothetical protein AF80_00080 [Aliarcobacter butzleri L355]|uniref:Capsule polysaccharide biosynthesis protein n=1 Tax=Aliarcobacter butzleri L355 TaxID=1447263 RepID=A0A0G9L194_9BACT|nr:hypothetical protein [Aliarcobacter butzleri]KLE11780.1 hypothetical protein AF80_00080 [Aliarcobacter butzleri L355]